MPSLSFSFLLYLFFHRFFSLLILSLPLSPCPHRFFFLFVSPILSPCGTRPLFFVAVFSLLHSLTSHLSLSPDNIISAFYPEDNSFVDPQRGERKISLSLTGMFVLHHLFTWFLSLSHLSLSLSLFLSHTHTHTHTLSLSLTLSPPIYRCLGPIFSLHFLHSHSPPSPSLSHSPSLRQQNHTRLSPFSLFSLSTCRHGYLSGQ